MNRGQIKQLNKKIEKAVNKKHGKERLFIVEEYNGRYFMVKDGQTIEIEKPVSNDPNKLLIIETLYSDPIL